MLEILPASQPLAGLRADSWKDVPTQSGIYWWYFPESCLETFRIMEYCDVDARNLRSNANGKVCLYVGVASNLQERTQWHAEQPLSQSALRSGYLSTFRRSLLALNHIHFTTGFDQINQFMDGLDVSWRVTADS